MSEDKRGGGQPGNQNRLVHGGEAGLRKLQKGEPFGQLAHAIYLEKLADIGLTEADLTGVDGLIACESARLLTVSELFWQAALGAAAQGDLDGFERYCQRLGWLSGKGTKALAEYLAAKPKGGIDYEKVLEAERSRTDGDT